METLIDGFYGLEGGMNSALSPHLIGQNQYHVGFNLTARNGQVGTRPGFSYFAAQLQSYRGGLLYKHADNSVSFVAVNGTQVVTSNASGTTGSFVAVPGVPALTSATSQVYFCEVGRYVVIQTGIDTPLVIAAPGSSSGAWASTTYGSKMPIGTHTAYGHGRIFTVVPSGAVAPKLTVALKPSTLVCTVTNGGGGYNGGNTNTFTKTSNAPKPVPKLTFPNGTTISHGALSSYSIVVTRGVVTSVEIGGGFSDVPSIDIITLNNAGTEITTGALGAGAVVAAGLTPTEVDSIGGGSTGSGYTLTPKVVFDNTGTGGEGASATVSRNGNTLTFQVTGGSGYRRPPRVIISDMGGSSQEVVASDISYGGSSEFYDIESSFSTGDGAAITLSQNAPFKEGESVTIEGHSSFPSVDGVWSVSSVGKVPSRKRGVASILIDDEGAGYKSPPTVVIDPPPEGGRRARATAVLATSITSVKVVNRGDGYDNDASNQGSLLEVTLVDDWGTALTDAGVAGFQPPLVELELGQGKAVDKILEDQVKEARVEDGGGPYPKVVGRVGVFNPSSGAWEWQKKNGTEIRKTLPLPPRLRVKDGYGVSPVLNARNKYVYPSGKKHAALRAATTAVVSELRITDSGAGYREVPNVELVGGKPTSTASVRAVLDSATTNDPKSFIIPALVATEGIGGRVRRSLGGTFEDIFNFTENIYLAEGGGFNVSGFLGKITGLFFLPVANTTSGRGDLVALGDKGAVTLAVGSPRTEWKDMAFIRVILSETGAVSDKSYTIAEGDVFFYSKEGLRSYRNASTGEVDGSVTPLDTELRGVLSLGGQSMSRLAYFNNRLMFTVSPSATNPNHFRALGVLDWASSYAGAESARPAWDGFWFAPGQDPNTTISSYFIDVHSIGGVFLVVCTNGIFKLDPSLVGDKTTAANTITPVRWNLETRSVDFSSPVGMKRLLRASIWVQDAVGTNQLSLQWRTENRPNWNNWVTGREHTGGTGVGKYAYRVDIPMILDTSTATDREMKVALDKGQSFQFRVRGSGQLRFVKFMFYALPTVESQYGVVASSAVTIVPTGTSESYPL